MKLLKEDNERESYGWEVKYGEEYDLLQDMIEMWGAEDVLNQITGAMGTDELAGILAYICRMNDYENSHMTDWEEDEEEIEESLNESITVELDEDEALDMLMNRLEFWSKDRITYDLYEQMYQSYIDGGAFDDGNFNVMQIVDNDWVNYCEVVEPGDEEHHYDELLKIYNEQGIGDVSTEDVGFSFIEAAVESDGKIYFLCRW